MATGGGGSGGGDVDRLFAGESAELTTSDAPATLLVLDTRRVLLGDELRDFVCAAGEASSSPFVYDVVMMDGAQKVRCPSGGACYDTHTHACSLAPAA